MWTALVSLFVLSFKPCYKWNTFNTISEYPLILEWNKVLNLVISGIPSILKKEDYYEKINIVLNLVISGIPSILNKLSHFHHWS